MWLFLAFLMVPLIEIALFIQIGGAIGLWPTLAIVVLTAVIGTTLVRNQGLMALRDVQGSFAGMNDPTEPLAHGAMIVFAGAMLLTPGFFTDGVGFLLLVPGVRSAVMRFAKSRISVQTMHMQSPRPYSDDTVVDVEYHEIDPEKPRANGPSGWTKQ